MFQEENLLVSSLKDSSKIKSKQKPKLEQTAAGVTSLIDVLIISLFGYIFKPPKIF